MLDSFQNAKRDVASELAGRGLEMTPTAMSPLGAIDFSRLVNIYDHEEQFLHDVFVSSLLDAHQARLRDSRGTKKINRHDVKTAMLMLGAAVSAAAEQTVCRQRLWNRFSCSLRECFCSS